MRMRREKEVIWPDFKYMYTALSRKAVRKSACHNPKRYCGWFWIHFSSKKFEKTALEAMDICLWVLKESTTNKFDHYNRQEQCIDDIPCYLSGLSRAHFYDNFSRNSCIPSLFFANREFKMLQRRWRWEYNPQSNMFNKQNNNFACAEHFFANFYVMSRNCLVSHFLEDVNKRRWNFLLLFELGYGC